MEINKEIFDLKKYLSAIEVAMNKLLESVNLEKNQQVIKDQKKIFKNLNMASSEENFYKYWKKYLEKTSKNLKKLKSPHVFFDISKIEFALEKEFRKFDNKQIDKIINILEGNRLNFKDAIMALSNEYNATLRAIETYRQNEEQRAKTVELEKQKKENAVPVLTEEQIDKKRKQEKDERVQQKIEKNSSVLLAGPKSGGLISTLQGKDDMLKDMKYLYGLAFDLLMLMESNQQVNIKNCKYGKEARVWDAYFDTINNKENKVQILLNSYGVNNIDALLDKYEKIRKLYYKKFMKLSIEKRDKYDISNFESIDISSSLEDTLISGTLLASLQNEKLTFPPSKEKLIELINIRIMNGNGYKLVTPENREEIVTGRPLYIREYDDAKNYYKNLTKNMTIEETAQLYKRVIMDIGLQFQYSTSEEVDFPGYYAVMQRLFCEIIFDKKDMKYSDIKQRDEAMVKIAKEFLDEELKYSSYATDEISNEEKQKRQNTVEREYVKYRARLTSEGKKEHLSFNEFAKQKYSLENMEEPLKLEDMIKEETRGMKK